MMFQIPGTSVAGLQAASSKIPWITVSLTGEPEDEIHELKEFLKPIVDGEYIHDIWNEEQWLENWPKGWIMSGRLAGSVRRSSPPCRPTQP